MEPSIRTPKIEIHSFSVNPHADESQVKFRSPRKIPGASQQKET